MFLSLPGASHVKVGSKKKRPNIADQTVRHVARSAVGGDGGIVPLLRIFEGLREVLDVFLAVHHEGELPDGMAGAVSAMARGLAALLLSIPPRQCYPWRTLLVVNPPADEVKGWRGTQITPQRRLALLLFGQGRGSVSVAVDLSCIVVTESD